MTIQEIIEAAEKDRTERAQLATSYPYENVAFIKVERDSKVAGLPVVDYISALARAELAAANISAELCGCEDCIEEASETLEERIEAIRSDLNQGACPQFIESEDEDEDEYPPNKPCGCPAPGCADCQRADRAVEEAQEQEGPFFGFADPNKGYPLPKFEVSGYNQILASIKAESALIKLEGG